GAEGGTEHGIAGDVAAGPGQARHQAGAHRIADADHHDRDRRRRGVGRDQVDRATHELAHHGREAVGHALAVAVFVVDALAFDVAELAQGLAEAMPHRRVVNDSDARYTRWLLLRLCRQRPRCSRAAEQRYDVPPLQVGHGPAPASERPSPTGSVYPAYHRSNGRSLLARPRIVLNQASAAMIAASVSWINSESAAEVMFFWVSRDIFGA